MKYLKLFVILVLACSMLLTISCAKDKDPVASAPSYYIGNINSKVFHTPTCSYLPDQQNRITFNTRQDAVNAGYSPCGHCNP